MRTLEEAVTQYMARCVRRGDCLTRRTGIFYGTVSFERGKSMGAHRASYIVHNGPIPHGEVVRHTCDNPTCVEPTHLLVGSHWDNAQDKASRNRTATGINAPSAAPIQPEVIRAAIDEYVAGDATQAEMAARLGVSKTTFGRWVRAERRLDIGRSPVRVGRGKRRRRTPPACGTMAGYGLHLREGTQVCDACRQAHRAYYKAYRLATQSARAAS